MPTSTQFQPKACYDLTATITNGQTTSTAVDLAGTALCGLFLPSTFDGTTLTITAASDPAGPFVTVQAAGSDYTLTTAASKYCPVENLAVVAGLRFIKLVAGTTQTTTDTLITIAAPPGMSLLTLLRPSGTFTPSALPGLVLWLTAGPTWCFTDTGGTTPAGAGGSVALWKDRSGNGYDVSQATGANQPTLQQDASGKYYVSFGGSAHLHRGTLPQLYAQPNTMCFAFRRTSGTRLFDGFVSTSVGTSRFEPFSSYRLACGATLSSGTTDTSDHTMFGLCNGAASAVYVDGASLTTGDAGTGGIDALNVGASEAGTTAFTGRCYGGVVTHALLTAPQLAQVQAYLRGLMP